MTAFVWIRILSITKLQTEVDWEHFCLPRCIKQHWQPFGILYESSHYWALTKTLRIGGATLNSCRNSFTNFLAPEPWELVMATLQVVLCYKFAVCLKATKI